MKKFDIRVFMTSVRREAGEEAAEKLSVPELARLVRRTGEDFVREAYWRVLGRDVDPDGLAGYREKAATLPGRALILAALLLSPERILMPGWLRGCVRLAGRPFRKSGNRTS